MNMTNSFSTFELVLRTRRGGSGRTQRDYLDFVVDGQSLHDLLKLGDNIGCLGWLPQDSEQVILQQLMAERLSVLENDRYPIYVCAECGDIGCGAVTVQIEKAQNGFVWKNFGYENDYDKSMRDLETYKNIGPFHFKQEDYVDALRSSQRREPENRKSKRAS
jgi:hypothetical protein